MDNVNDKAAVFPALLERAEKAAEWLSENQGDRKSHLDDFSGFFAVRNGEQKDSEQVIHQFTFNGADYLLVTD